MKKFFNMLLCSCGIMLLSACSESSSEDSKPAPVISEGFVDSNILHDSPKIGNVVFKPASHIEGSVFSWSIAGATVDNNQAKEITANFKEAGKYLVTLNVDGQEYKGNIIIEDEPVYEIDMGESHTIISDKNNLYLYGSNDKGQLCIEKGIVNLKYPRILKGYHQISSVATGSSHTLFTDNNYYIYACGDNSFGQLGVDTGNTDKVQVVSSIPDMKYNRIFVSGGGNMSFIGTEFLDGDSAKLSLYYFGYNDNATSKIQNQPQLLSTPDSSSQPLLSTGNNFSIVRNGYNVYSFGINDKWQLGRVEGAGIGYASKDTISQYNPDDNPSLNKTDMATGYVFAPYGEENLDGDEYPRNYYQNPYFAKISTGDDFVVSIKKETTEDSEWTSVNKYAVYVWGNNDKNQLGFANKDGNSFVRRPTALFNYYDDSYMASDNNQVLPIKKEMVEVAAGRASGYAISKDGILYGWGDNTFKQFTSHNKANNTNNLVYEIEKPQNITAGYKKVWAGGDRVIVLAGDDNLYTWGDNKGNILGIDNSEEIVAEPTKLFFSLASVD